MESCRLFLGDNFIVTPCTFHRDISPKVNVTARLIFKLVCYDVTVQNVSHWNSPKSLIRLFVFHFTLIPWEDLCLPPSYEKIKEQTYLGN